jgi:chorismate mutase
VTKKEQEFLLQLQDLRSEIDKIDRQMLELIHSRLAVVAKVKDLKENLDSSAIFIKSAREADMIKNLVAESEKLALKSKQKVSSDVIVDIWRKIIATSNLLEQKLSIGFVDNVIDEDFSMLVAAQYYHYSFAFNPYQNNLSLFSALETGECDIAIESVCCRLDLKYQEVKNIDLSSFIDDNYYPWWLVMLKNNIKARIFCYLPLYLPKQLDKSRFFSIANKRYEKSSSDDILLVLTIGRDAVATSGFPKFLQLINKMDKVKCYDFFIDSINCYFFIAVEDLLFFDSALGVKGLEPSQKWLSLNEDLLGNESRRQLLFYFSSEFLLECSDIFVAGIAPQQILQEIL